jgi:hypothetical protein
MKPIQLFTLIALVAPTAGECKGPYACVRDALAQINGHSPESKLGERASFREGDEGVAASLHSSVNPKFTPSTELGPEAMTCKARVRGTEITFENCRSSAE